MEIQSKQGKKFHIEHWQIISFYLMIYDALAVSSAHFLALWIRFDCKYNAISDDYLTVYFKFIPIYAVICIVVFKLLHLYNSIWRFASYSELLRISMATVITSIFNVVGTMVVCSVLENVTNQRMPFSYYFFGTIIQFLLILGVRFAYRFILLLRGRHKADVESRYVSRVMLIGAGNAGQLILRDIKASSETSDKVCCIIDDNPNKWNRSIDGIPVVGGRDDILTNVEKYKIEKIYIAIPSAQPEDRRDILNICKETGCELKNLPGVYQFVNGDVKVSSMKNVMVEDLLGREAIKVNMEEIYTFITGKVILVTGGGGSIGSELCRQIAKHKPKHLIIFEIYENNAYDIENELRKKYPELNLTVLIGSVRDTGRVNSIFAEYKPEVVYHAAAHKHVPLMEGSACEAIKNNTIGTYKTAYAAMMNGCQRFVLISTDKAVNPTNIMGASKRLCEMVIQTFDRMVKEKRIHEMPVFRAHSQGEELRTMSPSEAEHIKTEFVAVRFGNVLGSNGSVVPLFKKQIAAGGPVTVTHPDIIRYFMTIPEAVSLVLQAGVYARGGEIFVLDMGEPVKIDTLARNLIKLSGYKPDVDIKIEYTGLRPGEKLYEEKLMAEEDMGKTENQLIHIGKPIEFDTDKFLEDMDSLLRASYAECKDIRTLVAKIVPTYQPDKKQNKLLSNKLRNIMEKRHISFSPPDISEAEIAEVGEALKSGWITTGPRTKELERKLAEYCNTSKVVCLNSATAAEELSLRVLGIGEGDEVIVPAYTYTATASAAIHVGAKVVFIDSQKDSCEMDYDQMEAAITERTKAIVAVDLAGIVADYDRIYHAVENKKALFAPNSEIQKAMGRVAVLADGAHSLGASRNGKMAGEIADFTSFSFHAVKNFTTAEGGAATWRDIEGINSEWIYKQFQLFSLHGQSKDALAKTKLGAWEYDIVFPGYKCNMTDIMAAIGLKQFDRYPGMLARRREIIEKYDAMCDELGVIHLEHYGENHASSGHLYLTRIPGITHEQRCQVIEKMAERGVATNVHYKPLPMMTAYKDLGFDIKDYPNAYAYYENLVSLPLHTSLTDEDVEYVMESFGVVVKEVL